MRLKAGEDMVYSADKLPNAFPTWREYRDYLLSSAPIAPNRDENGLKEARNMTKEAVTEYYQRLTEEKRAAEKRQAPVSKEGISMFQVFEDNAGGLYLFVFDGEEMVYACMGFEHTPGNLRQCVEELQTQGLNAVQGWEGNREPWDGLEATPEETHAQLCDWVHQGMGGARIIADQDGIYYDRMGASGSIEFEGGHEMSTDVLRELR